MAKNIKYTDGISGPLVDASGAMASLTYEIYQKFAEQTGVTIPQAPKKEKKIIKGSKVKTPQGIGKVWAVERFPEDNLTIIVVEFDSEPGVVYEFSPTEVERIDVKEVKEDIKPVKKPVSPEMKQAFLDAIEKARVTQEKTRDKDLTDWREYNSYTQDLANDFYGDDD